MIECAGTCHLHPQRLPLPIFHLLYRLIFPFHARKSSREQIIGFPPLKYSATRLESAGLRRCRAPVTCFLLGQVD